MPLETRENMPLWALQASFYIRHSEHGEKVGILYMQKMKNMKK